MTNELKSHLPAEDKNLAALTVKTVQAHLVCLPKVKRLNQVQIAFEVIQLKKVVMQINQRLNQSLKKAQALETLTPIHHAVFDVVNNRK